MKKTIFIIALFSICCSFGVPSFAQSLSAFGLPAVTSVEELNGETTYSLSLQILMLMTALTVLPSLVQDTGVCSCEPMHHHIAALMRSYNRYVA